MVTDWLESNLQLALYLVPVFAFAEACVGLGLFVSGIFLVAVATAALGSGTDIFSIMLLAFGGALLGDHVGYYAGRWLGPVFHHLQITRRYSDGIARSEDLIRRHGALTIFIGRFIPAIRSLIPALLGISGFARLRYSLLDALACFLWSLGLGLIVTGVDNVL